MTDRNTHRLQIKRTVERAIPMVDIDVTKILSDEESEELHRQTEQRVEAVRLATEVGRAGLKDRLKKTMAMFTAPEEDATEADRPSSSS